MHVLTWRHTKLLRGNPEEESCCRANASFSIKESFWDTRIGAAAAAAEEEQEAEEHKLRGVDAFADLGNYKMFCSALMAPLSGWPVVGQHIRKNINNHPPEIYCWHSTLHWHVVQSSRRWGAPKEQMGDCCGRVKGVSSGAKQSH